MHEHNWEWLSAIRCRINQWRIQLHVGFAHGLLHKPEGQCDSSKTAGEARSRVCSMLSAPKSPSPVLSTLQFTFCQCTWVSFQLGSAKGEGEGWCTPEACSNLRPDLEETWIPCLWGSLESLMPCNPMKESYADIPHKQRHQAHLKLYFLFKRKRIPLGQSIFLLFIPPAMCMHKCFCILSVTKGVK